VSNENLARVGVEWLELHRHMHVGCVSLVQQLEAFNSLPHTQRQVGQLNTASRQDKAAGPQDEAECARHAEAIAIRQYVAVAEDDLLGVDVQQLCSGPKALADVVEALIAALFLDSNGTIDLGFSYHALCRLWYFAAC
jgi:dsRNA-specific ribonuclease